jgi:hypothetical protein
MTLRRRLSDYTQEEISEAYRSVFKSPKGAIVLLHLASACHLDETTFVAGDPNFSAEREGERRIILEILKRMNTPVLDYINDTEEQEDDTY